MKRFITGVAVAAATLVSTAVLASPASAVGGTCTSTFGVKVQTSAIGAVAYIPSAGGTLSGTDCGMAQGAYSSAVGRLQWELNQCYYVKYGASALFPEPLRLDNSYGAKTRDAVKFAQGKAGARVDGEYGPETRNLMNHYWAVDRSSDCNRIYTPPIAA